MSETLRVAVAEKSGHRSFPLILDAYSKLMSSSHQGIASKLLQLHCLRALSTRCSGPATSQNRLHSSPYRTLLVASGMLSGSDVANTTPMEPENMQIAASSMPRDYASKVCMVEKPHDMHMLTSLLIRVGSLKSCGHLRFLSALCT